MKRAFHRWIFILFTFLPPAVLADAELEALSLEELMTLEVTSAGKKSESLGKTAAAIHVITAEDIRRRGILSIPEALRLVPGMHVAQIDATKWAISARGFNDLYARRLLVLMDGRHLYTPSFSGVFWDEHSIPMEDIERIEVIRGPGATLWGSNAVNGVINIITRDARINQGLLLQASSGEHGTRGLVGRYGWTSDAGWHLKINANIEEADYTESPVANDRSDVFNHARLGFRAEGTAFGGDAITIDSSLYQGDSEETVIVFDSANLPTLIRPKTSSIDTSGGFVRLGWERFIDNGDSMSAQFYVDRSTRRSGLLDIRKTTYSLDFQRRVQRFRNHDIIWGAGIRYSQLPFESRAENIQALNSFDEDFTTLELFAQDEIALGDSVRIIYGAKLETSEYADFELQPNIRTSWDFASQGTLWAAISKAARTPSQAETQNQIIPNVVIPPGSAVNPLPLPVVPVAIGTEDFDAEDLIAYEVGVRFKPLRDLDVDITLFYHDYTDQTSITAAPPTCQPSGTSLTANPACLLTSTYVIAPSVFDNNDELSTSGIEIAYQFFITDSWRVSGTVHRMNHSKIQDVQVTVKRDPDYGATLSTELKPSKNTDFAISVRTVDDIPVLGIESYVSADIRLGWRPVPEFSVELIAKNLGDSGRMEFASSLREAVPTKINSYALIRLTWAP